MIIMKVGTEQFEFEINDQVSLEDARGGFFIYNNATKRAIELDSEEASIFKFIHASLKNSGDSLTIDKITDYQRIHYKLHEKEIPMIRGNIENILLKLKQEEILINTRFLK